MPEEINELQDLDSEEEQEEAENSVSPEKSSLSIGC
jgi:hypothetical protein